MKLDLKKIHQLDKKQLYNILLPTINDIYSSFKYIEINEKDFYELVFKEITDSKKTYLGDQNYIDFLKKKIKFKLSEQVKKLIINPKTSFNILNNYINQKFTNVSNYDDALKYFKKLSSFLETYNYIPNQDLLIELVNKNILFNKMTEMIFKQYYLQIIFGKAEDIFDDTLLILAIDTYCMLNNIEIKEYDELSQEIYETDSALADSVKTYLEEIGRRPLLTVEQERKLALRIAEGDTKAREQFIESNLRLVVDIAKKYIGRGLDFLDLIQEGNLGLMTAVDKYNLEKGYNFSTYATWWIRAHIVRSIMDKGKNIRIPINKYQELRAYKKAITKLEDKLNRTPTINEIANEMGISISKVTNLSRLPGDTVSLNSIVGDEEDSELQDFIPAEEETPEDIAIISTLQPQLQILFEKCNLKPREIDILMLRNGFNDNNPMTLEDIGKKYNVTRERIRQIEAKAYMKIRNSKHIEELAVYMDNKEKALQNIEKFRENYIGSINHYKIYLKDYGRIKEKEKDEKMIKTIYQKLNDYTKEQVDEMLTKLTEEERELLIARYGQNLDNPVSTKLTKEQTDKFYGSLVPKMKRLLANLTSEKKSQKPRPKKEKVQQPLVKSIITLEKPKPIEKSPSEIEASLEFLKVEKEVPVQHEQTQTSTDNGEITKADYVKMLELLRTQIFEQLTSVFSAKESIILLLKLWDINGKTFSTESIAQFLEIEKTEVIETTKKALFLFKENINNFLDNIIAATTEQVGECRSLSIKTPNKQK